MTLTRASLDFISRKAKRGRRAVVREERVGPTPETKAKLMPDPLSLMLQYDLIDAEAVHGAEEIARVYGALVGPLVIKARGESLGGRSEMTPRIAWIYSHRYRQWADKWSGDVHAAVIDMICEGQMHPAFRERIANALRDYAAVRRLNPIPHDLTD